MDSAGFTDEQQREFFFRRRKELEALFLKTKSFLEQCIVAKQFGELCEEEHVFLHGRKPISKAEWMDLKIGRSAAVHPLLPRLELLMSQHHCSTETLNGEIVAVILGYVGR